MKSPHTRIKHKKAKIRKPNKKNDELILNTVMKSVKSVWKMRETMVRKIYGKGKFEPGIWSSTSKIILDKLKTV